MKCKNPSNDFQQCQAYDWEDSFTLWAGHSESKEHMLKLIAHSARAYRVPVPRVRFFKSDHAKRNKYASSYYDPNTHTLHLRPRHMRANVALHEVAHAITDWIMGPHSRAGHGKIWLGVYMELLVKFKVMPRKVLEYSAKLAGLKWDTRTSPKTIRKGHKKQVLAAKRLRRILSIFTKQKGPATLR